MSRIVTLALAFIVLYSSTMDDSGSDSFDDSGSDSFDDLQYSPMLLNEDESPSHLLMYLFASLSISSAVDEGTSYISRGHSSLGNKIN